MSAASAPRLSVEQYLALDRDAELKSEYHDGEVFPMNAVSWTHAQLAARMITLLQTKTEGGPCKVGAPIRIRISPSKYVYPDIVLICGQPAFTDEAVDTITNPKLIVEVLSPSTSDYDRGGKFELYRELPTFEEYVLVSQDRIRIETRHRTPEGDWLLQRFDGPEAAMTLKSLGVSIPLASVYAGVLS